MTRVGRHASISAWPAERHPEKVWTLFTKTAPAIRTAEKRPISRSFPACELTGGESRHCYTFERFASCPDEIRTYYYYHYKRNISGLKEETKWS